MRRRSILDLRLWQLGVLAALRRQSRSLVCLLLLRPELRFLRLQLACADTRISACCVLYYG